MKFAKHTQSPILPIHVNACNSLSFYTVSILYKQFDSMLLVHGMIKFQNSVIEFTVGELIAHKLFRTWVSL